VSPDLPAEGVIRLVGVDPRVRHRGASRRLLGNALRQAALIAGLAVLAYFLYIISGLQRKGNPLFYRGGRPNRLGRAIGDLWSRVAAAGFGPSYLVSLETVGRRSGSIHAIPVVLADHGGHRYVVSMLGERSPWVHNVRAADGRAVIRHGRRRAVRLVEIPPEARAPIIKAFLRRAVGGRPHIPVDPEAPIEAYEAIAAEYPVFRLERDDRAAIRTRRALQPVAPA
jgi:deazaflavin-dependent oxidoreductase (nitroreductase family)